MWMIAVAVGVLVVVFIYAKYRPASFWGDFLPTLLAALIGIPAALYVDRLAYQQQQKADQVQAKAEEDQRRLALIHALEESLLQNKDILVRLRNEWRHEKIDFFNVDPLFLEATANTRHQLIRDPNVNLKLESIRAELGIIHRLLTLKVNMAFDTTSALTSYEAKRATLGEVILARGQRVETMIDEAVELLRTLESTMALKPAR